MWTGFAFVVGSRFNGNDNVNDNVNDNDNDNDIFFLIIIYLY